MKPARLARPALPLRSAALLVLAFAGCGHLGSSGATSDLANQAPSRGARYREAAPAFVDAPSPAGTPYAYEPGAVEEPAPPRVVESERAPSPEYEQPPSAYRIDEPPPPDRRPPVERVRPDRPGLGTVWGETRYSSSRDVTFERASAQPAAVATLYYNDHEGVSAMADYDARHAAPVAAPVTVGDGLSVSIVDDEEQPLQAVALGGRVYVVGEAGSAYKIVMSNHTPRRIEVVVSVDGLDVIGGRPAHFGLRGYVIDPWDSMTVDGFRRSHAEVAAFRFGSVRGSYAARSTGSDREVGVIGVALFQELSATPWPVEGPWSDDEIERRRTARPFAEQRFARPPLP